MGREEVRAAEGRLATVTPFFPSNPVLAGNAARREGGYDGPAVLNWQASIAQEIEIAGQRGARLRSVESDVTRQRELLSATTRDATATAWVAYFDALAASEEEALARTVASSGAAFVTAAVARAEKGLASPLDADLARASALRLETARIDTARDAVLARADLATLLGVDPERPPRVAGTLDPLATREPPERADAHAASRPEVRAAEADARAEAARAETFRRSRVPNPTISLFGGSEEFYRSYYGIGLSLPVPLPEPLGRTRSGEIAEAEALSARASVDAERLRRGFWRDVANARTAYLARLETVALYHREETERGRAMIVAIADEVSAGRMAIRDAAYAEQALLERLRGEVEARRELCVASVELERVMGELDEGRAP